MRVLGVDPGLTRCGWGVIDSLPGRTARLVDVGVVRTPSTEPLHERLLSVALALETVIVRLAPDVVAVERVFAQANVSTVMGTAQAAGIAMMLAARAGLGVASHTPSEVKAAVTGNGRADKAQVTTMVTRILGLEVAPRPADAADALALALCHLWRAAAPTALGGGTMSGGGAPTAAQSAWAQAAAAAARGADRSPIALAARNARRGVR